MKLLSKAGLPEGSWSGQAVLIFQRTAWFSDGSYGMVGLLAAGVSPSPAGMELAGGMPRVLPGYRLESDGRRWFLEGTGELAEVENSLDATAHIPVLSTQIWDQNWKKRWIDWLGDHLPPTAEGRWLAELWQGPGTAWESLLGKGSGSTPLGDDYLAGWLIARSAKGELTQSDKDRLLGALEGTSRLSRHFLWHLAHGRIHAQIAGFLGGAFPPLPGSPAATSLAGQGDLSGRATVAGLVAGLGKGA